MAVTINGTTGVTSPGITDTGALSVTGTTTLGAMGSSVITSGTAVASTSGTSIDYTGIPSWVKRITVQFRGVSLSSSASILIQLGTGSTTYTTSGYISTGLVCIGGGNSLVSDTTGFIIYPAGAANNWSGHLILTNITGNNWVSSHVGKYSTGAVCSGAGDVSLSAVLTAVRITTNSTDTFDAGTVNILYE